MSPRLTIALALLGLAQEPKNDGVPPPPPVPPRVGPRMPVPVPVRPVPDAMKAAGPAQLRVPVPARPALPPPPDAPADGPTPVTIDFKDAPVAQVIRTLAERTGGMIDTFNTNDAQWADQRVTLDARAPVPFWEVVDRLTAAARLIRTVAPSGPASVSRTHVQFMAGSAPRLAAFPSAGQADEGLVAYVGPFRVGPVVVHEHFDRVFLPGRLPTTGEAPPPVPFYVEIPLMAEPNLLAAQVGPLRRVEAVDDAGRSLLDPKLRGEVPAGLSMAGNHGPPRSLRVPLVRADGPSKSLARLRGALPLEVARRPAAPTLVVPLEGASGKTFRDGDVAITVREYRADPSGPAVVRLTARLEGPRGAADPGAPGLAGARLWSIYQDQIDLADAQSRPVRALGSNTSQGGPEAREIQVDYTFAAPTGARPSPPTQLRLYRPRWITWDLPLDFRDIPLP